MFQKLIELGDFIARYARKTKTVPPYSTLPYSFLIDGDVPLERHTSRNRIDVPNTKLD